MWRIKIFGSRVYGDVQLKDTLAEGQGCLAERQGKFYQKKNAPDKQANRLNLKP